MGGFRMVLMTYNDKDLSELITIQEVVRTVGNERVVTTDDSPLLGVNVKRVKTSAKTITVKFYMKNKFNKYALNQDKHTLAGILNVDKPVKITFDDEPDKYYKGFVTGLPDSEDPIAWLSVVSMELLIPDGVAHSSTYKEFTDYTIETKTLNVDTGKQLLNNASGPFKPQRNPSDNYDNYAYFNTTNIQLTKGKTYAIKAQTDGLFSSQHNVNIESDNVVLWLAPYGHSVGWDSDHKIVSDENTATGTSFYWDKPSGNYVLRVNTYHKDPQLLKSVSNVKIVETGAGSSKTILYTGDVVFRPDSKPSNFDNVGLYPNQKVLMENGVTYVIKAQTDGLFSSQHNGNVESDNVVLWLTNKDSSINVIISNETTGTTGTTFTWQKPTGEYFLRVNTYHRDSRFSVSNLIIQRGDTFQNEVIGENKLTGGSGTFKPNRNPNDDFDNYQVYDDTNIYIENGKSYLLRCSTDGIMSDIHLPNVESNRVVLWVVNDKRSVNTIVSNEDTARGGNVFTWKYPSGLYRLRVNTYHKYSDRSVSNITITENEKELSYFKMPIINNGNVEALPIIEITSRADNGYYGIVNSKGFSAVGDDEATDGVIKTFSDTLYNFKKGEASEALKYSYVNETVTNDPYKIMIFNEPRVIKMFGYDRLEHIHDYSVTAGKLSVSSVSYDLISDRPEDDGSLYEFIQWKQLFWSGQDGDAGCLKVSVSDIDNNFIYGVETIKQKNGLITDYNFVYRDENGGYGMKNIATFLSTQYHHQNPFNEEEGVTQFSRNDSSVDVYWRGNVIKMNTPSIKGKKAKKVHFTFITYPNKVPVRHMYFDSFLIRNSRSNYLADSPNRYYLGSKLVLNSENKTIQQNGNYDISQKIIGSDFIKIPVGESELEFYTSSWSTDHPEIKVKFEERHL